MEAFYKFVDKRGFDGLMNGTVMFRNVNYFRMLEVVYRDQMIGDKNEAYFETKSPELIIEAGRVIEGSLSALSAAGINITPKPGASVNVTGNTIASVQNPHIICLAFGELEKLIPVLTEPDRDGVYYDHCVKVDVKALAAALPKAILVNDTITPNRTFAGCFNLVAGKPVVYEDGKSSSDAFFKDKRYAGQCEYRIAGDPVQQIPDGAIFKLLDPQAYFTPQIIDVPPSPKPKASAWLTAPQVRAEMMKVCTEADNKMTAAGNDASQAIAKSYLPRLAELYWMVRPSHWDQIMDRHFTFYKIASAAVNYTYRYAENLPES